MQMMRLVCAYVKHQQPAVRNGPIWTFSVPDRHQATHLSTFVNICWHMSDISYLNVPSLWTFVPTDIFCPLLHAGSVLRAPQCATTPGMELVLSQKTLPALSLSSATKQMHHLDTQPGVSDVPATETNLSSRCRSSLSQP